MRHGDKIKNLSRTASHRRALLSNLACQLITHKRVVTTLAKAKALRVYVEPLITKAKENTTHQRRIVFSYLQDKEAITELFSTVSEKIAGRPGGYTRVIKLGARVGDNAETALISMKYTVKEKAKQKKLPRKPAVGEPVKRQPTKLKKLQQLLLKLPLQQKKRLQNKNDQNLSIQAAQNMRSFFGYKL
jgi:large subunit ribosomal protein L17